MKATPLQSKTAIVYGAGGWVSSAVAQAYAEVGARVFLAGRSADPRRASTPSSPAR